MVILCPPGPLSVALRWLPSGRRASQGAGEHCRSWPGRRLLPRCAPPALLAVLTGAGQVGSAGEWRLRTNELGPDLTEAGTFLEEEGLKKNAAHSWPRGEV